MHSTSACHLFGVVSPGELAYIVIPKTNHNIRKFKEISEIEIGHNVPFNLLTFSG